VEEGGDVSDEYTGDWCEEQQIFGHPEKRQITLLGSQPPG